MTTVKLLEPGYSSAYREIILEALKEYPEFFGSGYEQQLNLEKMYFERLIEEKSEKGLMVGAYYDGELVGICGVTFETEVLPNAGEIIQMYVKADHQSQGVGKKLMRHIQDACATKDVSVLLLEVVRENPGAIKVYEQSGYILNESLGDDPNAVFMTMAVNQ
ncbi:GNAT family N-acetyltransferase [Reinekea forsetii]|uniref:N-acetyltransferase, GNAT family n=1 Tax=Reinekea forsetii TaxID=1336806 RepID=A0A2K8KLW1_9GAMM|nr:GNAT family N-acetyltransferase [Reinekea forsetii]ATX75858.1 N-acetyltransferase, GNAT family [Reinekea forsetii]